MKVPVDRSAKLADMRAYAAELAALTPAPEKRTYDPFWHWSVPEGVFYINALAGQVYCSNLRPSRQCLACWLEDAQLATEP